MSQPCLKRGNPYIITGILMQMPSKICSVQHVSDVLDMSACVVVHVGTGGRGGGVRSVRFSALVFVEMQLFHLLLQKGNGHGAASGSMWQRVDLKEFKTFRFLYSLSIIETIHDCLIAKKIS